MGPINYSNYNLYNQFVKQLQVLLVSTSSWQKEDCLLELEKIFPQIRNEDQGYIEIFNQIFLYSSPTNEVIIERLQSITHVGRHCELHDLLCDWALKMENCPLKIFIGQYLIQTFAKTRFDLAAPLFLEHIQYKSANEQESFIESFSAETLVVLIEGFILSGYLEFIYKFLFSPFVEKKLTPSTYIDLWVGYCQSFITYPKKDLLRCTLIWIDLYNKRIFTISQTPNVKHTELILKILKKWCQNPPNGCLETLCKFSKKIQHVSIEDNKKKECDELLEKLLNTKKPAAKKSWLQTAEDKLQDAWKKQDYIHAKQIIINMIAFNNSDDEKNHIHTLLKRFVMIVKTSEDGSKQKALFDFFALDEIKTFFQGKDAERLALRLEIVVNLMKSSESQNVKIGLSLLQLIALEKDGSHWNNTAFLSTFCSTFPKFRQENLLEEILNQVKKAPPRALSEILQTLLSSPFLKSEEQIIKDLIRSMLGQLIAYNDEDRIVLVRDGTFEIGDLALMYLKKCDISQEDGILLNEKLYPYYTAENKINIFAQLLVSYLPTTSNLFLSIEQANNFYTDYKDYKKNHSFLIQYGNDPHLKQDYFCTIFRLLTAYCIMTKNVTLLFSELQEIRGYYVSCFYDKRKGIPLEQFHSEIKVHWLNAIAYTCSVTPKEVAQESSVTVREIINFSQDCFLKIFKNLGKINSVKSFYKYLFISQTLHGNLKQKRWRDMHFRAIVWEKKLFDDKADFETKLQMHFLIFSDIYLKTPDSEHHSEHCLIYQLENKLLNTLTMDQQIQAYEKFFNVLFESVWDARTGRSLAFIIHLQTFLYCEAREKEVEKFYHTFIKRYSTETSCPHIFLLYKEVSNSAERLLQDIMKTSRTKTRKLNHYINLHISFLNLYADDLRERISLLFHEKRTEHIVQFRNGYHLFLHKSMETLSKASINGEQKKKIAQSYVQGLEFVMNLDKQIIREPLKSIEAYELAQKMNIFHKYSKLFAKIPHDIQSISKIKQKLEQTKKNDDITIITV